MYGYFVCLFDGPIVAVSKKSSKVSTSSTHNEFMALGEVAKACVYISDLLVLIEMGFPECVDPEGMPAADDIVKNTECIITYSEYEYDLGTITDSC